MQRNFAFCPHCGAELGVWSGLEHRKIVTVLFCDMVGSTRLGESIDPEALRALLARYFDRMKAIVEGHGGKVEKFIGDAVMAVFGVPVAHEDDALRAVRAALGMRTILPELGIQARIGINTGEVVTGTREWLAGDAVNVAARLEQAAQPNEVLLGAPTLALVDDAVEVEVVEPLALKGKAAAVEAYRLLGVHEPPEPRDDAMFVGRQRELAALRDIWARGRSEQRCELVTIVGDAGVGKSRLAAEFLAGLEDQVVRGRCLPYGEGITYWPVIEVLKQLDLVPADEAAAAAIGSLLGEGGAIMAADEIAWAFRKTLEHAAMSRPVVVVFDDIQWGEETFLDLIEHVALLSAGYPVLLLCLARPELSERRASWTVTLRLEPLADEDVEQLIGERVASGLRAKIARAAGGNPLFVHEMLAMAGQADGEVTVPPTLHALLSARLDQLDVAERSVLERGAVEGEVFHRSAVQALDPEATVSPRLAALVRKGLIRPDRPQLRGEDAFRFRHLLIRDAAYDSLSKSVRADMHERLASWLKEHGGELIELDELLGYHLEQACRYRSDLGLPRDEELTGTARSYLTDAGRRADLRHDYGAAASLLERAASLVPEGELDLRLEIELTEALISAGSAVYAIGRAAGVAERAAALGDRVGELCGRALHGMYRTYLEPEGATGDLEHLLEEALPVFEASGDDLALFVGYYAVGQVAHMRAHFDAEFEAYERAAVHARRADTSRESQLLVDRAYARLYGTTPIPVLLDWLDEQESQGIQTLPLKEVRSAALASLGQIEEAREVRAEYEAELADRGDRFALAVSMGCRGVEVDLLAGDPEAAVRYGRAACRMLEEMGQQTILSTMAGHLAGALCELDRLDEAEGWARRAAELAASDDMATQFLWRQASARVLARRGEHAEAERLGREAIAIADTTDDLRLQGNVYVDLAEVLSLAGRPNDAADILRGALERYERKGVVVMVERTRERLQALQERTVPS